MSSRGYRCYREPLTSCWTRSGAHTAWTRRGHGVDTAWRYARNNKYRILSGEACFSFSNTSGPPCCFASHHRDRPAGRLDHYGSKQGHIFVGDRPKLDEKWLFSLVVWLLTGLHPQPPLPLPEDDTLFVVSTAPFPLNPHRHPTKVGKKRHCGPFVVFFLPPCGNFYPWARSRDLTRDQLLTQRQLT